MVSTREGGERDNLVTGTHPSLTDHNTPVCKSRGTVCKVYARLHSGFNQNSLINIKYVLGKFHPPPEPNPCGFTHKYFIAVIVSS